MASSPVHKRTIIQIKSARRVPMSLIDDLKLTVPLIQAPMAGVSTPSLAAAVSEAGGVKTGQW